MCFSWTKGSITFQVYKWVCPVLLLFSEWLHNRSKDCSAHYIVEMQLHPLPPKSINANPRGKRKRIEVIARYALLRSVLIHFMFMYSALPFCTVLLYLAKVDGSMLCRRGEDHNSKVLCQFLLCSHSFWKLYNEVKVLRYVTLTMQYTRKCECCKSMEVLRLAGSFNHTAENDFSDFPMIDVICRIMIKLHRGSTRDLYLPQ